MKGVSPLIATVLLLAITVAIAGVILNWSTEFTTYTLDRTSNKTKEAVKCIDASITIDAVFLTNSNTKAIVRNSGFTENLVIETAQLYDTSGNNFTAFDMPMTDVTKGKIVMLNFPNLNVGCWNFSKIVVQTTCGDISDTFTDKPTGC